MADTMLLEMAIHHFDSLRFVLGTDPLAAHGQTWRPPWTTYAGDTWVACGFTFPDGFALLEAFDVHALRAPGQFTSERWPANIKAMAHNTALTPSQIDLVLKYLQWHASDMPHSGS